MTERKQGKWFRFGKDHERLKVPEADLLTEEQWQVMDELYEGLGVASDNLLIDSDIRATLLRRFIEETGEHIADLLFVAALIARRKRGSLPRVLDGAVDDGFADIDEIAS